MVWLNDKKKKKKKKKALKQPTLPFHLFILSFMKRLN